MPHSPPRHAARREQALTDLEPAESGSRWIGWVAYAAIALVGFGFGVVVGNQRPKTIEVVKATPTESKAEPKQAEPKVETKNE